MVCWCRTNEKDKTESIAASNERVDMLTNAIEMHVAKGAQLATDIEQLGKEHGETSEALSKATEIRSKEASEFAAEEQSSLQTVETLKSAVQALGPSQPSFLSSAPS